jgi:hypothetical protein
MKHIPFLLTLLLFIACTSSNRNSEWLKQAEAHYEAGRGDSILTYLYKINENKLSEEENRTFHRIKLATVMQNAPEDLKMMHELATYYLQQNDTTHLQTMRGVLYRNYAFNKQYHRADSILQVMIHIYTHQQDTIGIRWYYSMKTHLHQSAGKIDSALHYFDKCMAISKGGKATPYEHYQKAQLWMQAGQYAQAESSLDSAQALAIEMKNEKFVYHLSAYYQELYTKQGQYDKALQKLQESRKYMTRKDVASHNMYKAHLFELMHREDSARYYYDVVARSENLFLATEAFYHLSQSALAHGELEKAYHFHQDATGYIDQVYRAYQSQAKNTAFNELKFQREIDELKINRQQDAILILSLIIVLLTLIATGIIHMQHKKRKETEILQKQTEQENLLLRQAEELSTLRERATALREELIRRMEVFQKLPSLNNKQENTDQAIRISDNEWIEIRNMLDAEYDSFTTRLRKKIPTLNIADLNFCCLLKINVSMQDLANIYCINKQSVSRRKQRIKEKIGNDLLQGLTLDEFIQRF